MESSILSSKKRKQPTPPPSGNHFIGRFTRSKSRMYLQRHCSDRAQLDAQMPGQFITNLRSLTNEDLLDVNSVFHGSSKDLRTRRIFSPVSTVGNESLLSPSDFVAKDDIKKGDLGFHCPVGESNDKSANLALIVNLCCSDAKSVEDNSFCDRILNENDPRLSERCFEQTPPELEEHEERRKKNGLNLNGDFVRSNESADQKIGSISRSKLVHGSCSRRKIFKTPNSFSYRRLLPFLADIAKDDFCVSKSEVIDAEFSCKLENSNDINHTVCEKIVECQDEKKSLKNGIKNNEIPLLCTAKDLESIKHNCPLLEDKTGLHVDQNSNGDFQHGVDGLTEENVQMTPPDADIFSKPEENYPRESMDNTFQAEDHVKGKLSYRGISLNDGGVAQTSGQNSDWRSNSISNSKLVLNPSSRLKVFRTPTSVSYRRLLPFLMEMAKDNPGSPKTNQCQTFVKDLEEKPKQPLLASLHQDVPAGSKYEDRCLSMENRTENQTGLEEKAKKPLSDSIHKFVLIDSKSEADSSPKENLTGDEKPNLPTAILVTHDGLSDDDMVGASELKHDISSITGRSEAASPSGEDCPDLALCSVVNHVTLPRECPSDFSQCNSLDNEGLCISEQKICRKDDGEPLKTVCLNQSSALVAADSQMPINDMRKGILKKYPRGCRGLCNCLNCASFRLHAERAFEFSRNQMQDAEELACELINELAYIRNMLKKSADVANNHALVPLNQVGEACMKALNTENLARLRLKEMNDDLKIHCRIACSDRPRVTFASNICEKVIPEADCQEDSLKKSIREDEIKVRKG